MHIRTQTDRVTTWEKPITWFYLTFTTFQLFYVCMYMCVCVCVCVVLTRDDKLVVFVWHVSKAKMSSNTDDTNLLAQNNLIYNSFDWKPITFTHVEYPKGKQIVFIEFWIRSVKFIEMFGRAAGILICTFTYTYSMDFLFWWFLWLCWQFIAPLSIFFKCKYTNHHYHHRHFENKL